MNHIIFDYRGPDEPAAFAWLRDQPPGEARCSCGAAATQLMVTGGSGAARYVSSFELYCGEGNHLTSPLQRWVMTLEADGDQWPQPW